MTESIFSANSIQANSLKHHRMKHRTIFLAVIFVAGLLSTKTAHATPNPPTLKGDYLGQKPPGKTPEIFAPGVISTKYYEHSAPAFSPDGKKVVWTVLYERGKPSRLMEMHQEAGEWTNPAPVTFGDAAADDFYPSFSYTGDKLYFCSRRNVPAGYKNVGLRIWQVENKKKGWGVPMPFDTAVSKGEDYAHSVTKEGTMYFSARRQGGRVFDILVSKKTASGYQEPKSLPYNINSIGSEDGPFIAPDESYLIFESQRPGGIEGSTDLYISFRKNDGSWGRAVNMGPAVNSKFTERFPRVSPDGKYLFFGSDRDLAPGAEGTDIYWVDASVINELRQQDKAENEISINSDGSYILTALYRNDFNGAATLLKQWVSYHPKDPAGYGDYLAALRRSQQFGEAETAINEMPKSLSESNDIKTELILIKYGTGKESEAEQIANTLPTQGMNDRMRFAGLASTLYYMNKFKESAGMYQRALNIQETSTDYYNMACSYARGDEKDKAFDALNKAADMGYNSKQNFEADTDLTPLKADPKWKTLAEKLK